MPHALGLFHAAPWHCLHLLTLSFLLLLLPLVFALVSRRRAQLNNMAHNLAPATVARTVGQLGALMSCKGADQCAKAGQPL